MMQNAKKDIDEALCLPIMQSPNGPTKFFSPLSEKTVETNKKTHETLASSHLASQSLPNVTDQMKSTFRLPNSIAQATFATEFK